MTDTNNTVKGLELPQQEGPLEVKNTPTAPINVRRNSTRASVVRAAEVKKQPRINIDREDLYDFEPSGESLFYLRRGLNEKEGERPYGEEVLAKTAENVLKSKLQGILQNYLGQQELQINKVKIVPAHMGHQYMVFMVACTVEVPNGTKQVVTLALSEAMHPRMNDFIEADAKYLNEIRDRLSSQEDKESILPILYTEPGTATTPALNIAPYKTGYQSVRVEIDPNSKSADPSEIAYMMVPRGHEPQLKNTNQIKKMVLDHELKIAVETGIPVFPSFGYGDYLIDPKTNRLLLTRYRDPRLYAQAYGTSRSHHIPPVPEMGPECSKVQAIAYQLLHILNNNHYTPRFFYVWKDLFQFLYSQTEVREAAITELQGKLSAEEKQQLIQLLREASAHEDTRELHIKGQSEKENKLAFHRRVRKFCDFLEKHLEA